MHSDVVGVGDCIFVVEEAPNQSDDRGDEK